MDEVKQQKELFEFEEPKRPFPRLAKILPKADFEGRFSFTFTLDRIIFMLIAIVMLLVVVYALGVERGRSLAYSRASAPPARPIVAIKTVPDVQQQRDTQFMSTAPIAKAKPATAAQKSAPIIVKQPVKTQPPPAERGSNKPYTIVAAAFGKRENAQGEVDRLKRDGLDSYMLFSDPYYLVCVGSYADRTGVSSMADFKKVRSRYRDAYFKLK